MIYIYNVHVFSKFFVRYEDVSFFGLRSSDEGADRSNISFDGLIEIIFYQCINSQRIVLNHVESTQPESILHKLL